MRPLSLIGKDNAFQPYITDYRQFSNRIVQLFHDQPLVIRRLAPMVETVQFDGLTEHETATLKDIAKPEYAFEPSNANTMIEGDSVIVKIPQFFFSASLLKEKWKALFAGKERMPILINRMIQKIKIEEDVVGLQGATKTATKGLVGTLTHDLGAPTGNWKTDATSDGILENAQADVDKGIDYFVAKGVGHYPLDVVLTSYAYNKLRNTIIPYSPGVNNIDIIRNKLNGGEIYVTNHLQDAVALAANTMLMIPRMPEAEAPWAILSSGIEQSMEPYRLWEEEFGIRERFAPKILDGTLVAWMKGITVA